MYLQVQDLLLITQADSINSSKRLEHWNSK